MPYRLSASKQHHTNLSRYLFAIAAILTLSACDNGLAHFLFSGNGYLQDGYLASLRVRLGSKDGKPFTTTIDKGFSVEIPYGANGPFSISAAVIDANNCRRSAGAIEIPQVKDILGKFTHIPLEVFPEKICECAESGWCKYIDKSGRQYTAVGFSLSHSSVLSTNDGGLSRNGILNLYNTYTFRAISKDWVSGNKGLMLIGDREVPVATGTTENLTGVWSVSDLDAWAVSETGQILHWDGSSWRNSSARAGVSLWAVWGLSATDVWVVGDRGYTANWDGSGWAQVPSSTNQNLRAIWGLGTNNVWAVGDLGTIQHWDGNTWSTQVSGTNANLRGISGYSQNEIWVVGDSGLVLQRSENIWKSIFLNIPEQLNAISNSGPYYFIAAGTAGRILRYMPL